MNYLIRIDAAFDWLLIENNTDLIPILSKCDRVVGFFRPIHPNNVGPTHWCEVIVDKKGVFQIYKDQFGSERRTLKIIGGLWR